jgi:hypothetical protein
MLYPIVWWDNFKGEKADFKILRFRKISKDFKRFQRFQKISRDF